MKACLIAIVIFLHFTCYSSSGLSVLTENEKFKQAYKIRNFFHDYIASVCDDASELHFIEKNREIIPSLSSYKDLDPYRNSLLHYAVNRPEAVTLKLIRFLLHHEKSLNSKNIAGATPLHIAAMAGAHKSCQFLLNQRELDRSIRDENGYIARDYAQRKEEKMRSLFLP